MKCDFCCRSRFKGNNRSHSNKWTRRFWKLNLSKISLKQNDKVMRCVSCTKCIKTLKKYKYYE